MRLAGREGAPISRSGSKLSSEFSCSVGSVAEWDMEYWVMLTGSSLPMSTPLMLARAGAWLVLTLVLGPPGVTRLTLTLAVLLLSLTPLKIQIVSTNYNSYDKTDLVLSLGMVDKALEAALVL